MRPNQADDLFPPPVLTGSGTTGKLSALSLGSYRMGTPIRNRKRVTQCALRLHLLFLGFD